MMRVGVVTNNSIVQGTNVVSFGLPPTTSYSPTPANSNEYAYVATPCNMTLRFGNVGSSNASLVVHNTGDATLAGALYVNSRIQTGSGTIGPMIPILSDLQITTMTEIGDTLTLAIDDPPLDDGSSGEAMTWSHVRLFLSASTTSLYSSSNEASIVVQQSTPTASNVFYVTGSGSNHNDGTHFKTRVSPWMPFDSAPIFLSKTVGSSTGSNVFSSSSNHLHIRAVQAQFAALSS